MPIDTKQMKGLFQGNKKLFIVIVVAAVIAYGTFFSNGPKRNTAKPQNAEHKTNVLESDKLLATVEGLRKDVEELKKNQGAAKQNAVAAGESGGAKPSSAMAQKKTESLNNLSKMINGWQSDEQYKPTETQRNLQGGQVAPVQQPQIAPRPENRLIKIDISETSTKETQRLGSASDDLYLPAGSFVSFTLKSSVFAPETGPEMPTSGVIDSAFIGPNKSTVPMQGCFFIGKAKGNTAEAFADIKPVHISCVWPDGESFEADTAGYVTDLQGNFGLKGEVDRHTGTFLSTQGIASFLEGFSQGLNRAQTVTSTLVSTSASATTTNINGSPYQYGGFAALGDMASGTKAFFAAQMQNLIPTVKTKPGERGYIHLTAGIRITGGKKNVVGNVKNYPYINNLSSAR